MDKKIIAALKKVLHPELNNNIVEAQMVENVVATAERISVTITFAKSRDPFMNSIKREAMEVLQRAFPKMHDKITIYVKEAPVKPKIKSKNEVLEGTKGVKRVIAIASGKGGVGKSTVTANLAVTLHNQGYSVGVLDADIYGPTQPRMFGLEAYQPQAEVKSDGREYISAAVSHGVKVISIGFFIAPAAALVWRGPMATSALKQLIHQTDWGELDFLLIDLPPGTGDVHLTALQELKIDGAVIVSTPQDVALDAVVRGMEMFRTKNIEIPILGIVENMAWFTPKELPDNRYYLFGRGGAAKLAEQQGVPLLGQIPIIQSVMDGGESGSPSALGVSDVAEYYQQLAKNIVSNLK